MINMQYDCLLAASGMDSVDAAEFHGVDRRLRAQQRLTHLRKDCKDEHTNFVSRKQREMEIHAN
jgi:hypothetical protein